MKNKRRRERLWQRDPHCFFCGVLTVPPPPVTPRGKVPDNQATLDHLRSRFHPDRREPNLECHERTVLACWRCNFERGKQEEASQPIALIRELSRYGQLDHPKKDEIKRAWQEAGVKFQELRRTKDAVKKRKSVRAATNLFLKDGITYQQLVEAIKLAPQLTS